MEFSLSFQLRLLLLFYTDKEFFNLSKGLVKQEFFNSLFCQWLFKYLEIYVDLYKSLPTKIVVEQELLSNKDFTELPEEGALISEFLGLLKEHDRGELSYVKDTFLKFAKSRSIRQVLNEQSDYIDSGNFEELFTSLKDESRKFDTLNVKERDEKLFSVLNLRELYENKAGIQTGLPLIDNVIGGLNPKELSIVLADTNVGKSLYLVHIGGSAVKQYKKVLHVTLEMSFARTLARYLANLGDDEDNISYQQIVTCDPTDKIINYVHDKLQERYEGFLQVEEYPTGGCGISDLYSLLDKFPDTELLIVDYLQIMKAIQKRTELRFELTDNTVAMRGIASEGNLHVASAAQAGRLARNKRIVDIGTVAEDYGIMRVADIGIAMGQGKNDIPKREVVLSIGRSRNSDKNVRERYHTDFKRMRLVYRRAEEITHE